MGDDVDIGSDVDRSTFQAGFAQHLKQLDISACVVHPTDRIVHHNMQSLLWLNG